MQVFSTQLLVKNLVGTNISYQNHGKKADSAERLVQIFSRDLANVKDFLSYKWSRKRNKAP